MPINLAKKSFEYLFPKFQPLKAIPAYAKLLAWCPRPVIETAHLFFHRVGERTYLLFFIDS